MGVHRTADGTGSNPIRAPTPRSTTGADKAAVLSV
jgi:hypothetical protein